MGLFGARLIDMLWTFGPTACQCDERTDTCWKEDHGADWD